jgi:arabinogalactan endo-1,4-beta-galactosidase
MQIELRKTGVHIGIIYVGFTENEENKQILYPDGTYRKMPARKLLQATREEVAKTIAKAI